MANESYGFEYEGRSILSHLESDIPTTDEFDDIFAFIMGPYTAFNAKYVYDDADQLSSPFIDDPLFDEDLHVTPDGRGHYDQALSDFCQEIREKLGIRAFIAKDINIPTLGEVEDNNLDEPGMSVLEQSIRYSAVSNAVIFIYSIAGLNAGPGIEAGAIMGEFNLRLDNDLEEMKPRKRFKIYRGPGFESASFEEIPSTYGVSCSDFEDKSSLTRQIRQFLVEIERTDRKKSLPVFKRT